MKQKLIYNCKSCGNTIIVEGEIGTVHPYMIKCGKFKGCRTGLLIKGPQDQALLGTLHHGYTWNSIKVEDSEKELINFVACIDQRSIPVCFIEKDKIYSLNNNSYESS